MEGENDGNTVPEMEPAGAVSEPQVPPVPEAAAVFEENRSYVGGDGGEGGMAVGDVGVGRGAFIVKRKRGRPRKQQGAAEVRQELMFVAAPSSTSLQKRGRGRPKGTGKWQTLAASLGESSGDPGESKFTPYTITIRAGENIAQRFFSFARRTCESLCIISASGTVSYAEIRQSSSCGGILRYEGSFDIVCLSGSQLDNIAGGVQGKICVLSVLLSDPDGTLVGGAVGDSLIAGGPTQDSSVFLMQRCLCASNLSCGCDIQTRSDGASD
ncbi:AT-hook motif nuclear-localized protein 9-like isoform X2 [Andrographis paniculata]|uniref:AT-hook motif nuclear-localized protein 9-like isoform X2 n=1 Tax=Andrographis paniculata TaxID=175694 RepID=UPI0021E8CE3D|nr:AT-hook motif nuclear-localized protein 9-like isoform X2 [Andrographis paniculata]